MCWWINGLLMPELTVYRGQTYYFKVSPATILPTLFIYSQTFVNRSKEETMSSWASRIIILSTLPVTQMEDMAGRLRLREVREDVKWDKVVMSPCIFKMERGSGLGWTMSMERCQQWWNPSPLQRAISAIISLLKERTNGGRQKLSSKSQQFIDPPDNISQWYVFIFASKKNASLSILKRVTDMKEERIDTARHPLCEGI